MSQIRELDTGTNITLFKDNGNKETFTITQTKDRGASVICYDVKRSDNSHGILKEFCPENSSSLIRNEKGYLIHQSGSENSSFKEHMKMYVDSYQLILDAVTKEDDLATIFPDVEIYYSPEEKNSDRTVYIWTKEPPRITFETFCKNIRNDHDSIAEDKLLRILKAILSLTECVGIIHCAGFIHRDIKPGNFGFLTRRSKIMEDSISLFDVDTVCSVFKAADLSDIGSPGFHEPELMYQPADNQTDIYSIGATLFHAIIVTEETSENGYFYNDELYDDIEELVYHSEIVKLVLKNVPNDFTELLVTVLKKSLCARRNRYLSCEDMSKDIDRAVKQIQPVVTNLQNNSARKGKWIYKTWSEQKQFGFTLASFLDDDEILKIENLLKAEERNDQICSKPQNAYILGIYYFAFKEERNHEKAEKYLKISADSGNEKAKNVYEYLCRSDEDKCNKKVIKKAIQNNCILTIHDRGINMTSFGLFIKKHEGKKLLFKSADMGHVGSMYMLAASYINKSTLFGISYIQNISKHEANSSKIQKKILKYVLTGVDRDIKDFKLLYADMYRQGYCFDQNIDHAIMLYRNLIKEECYFAYIFLHDCYILKKDYEQALNALEELSNIENTDKSNRTLAIELLANHYYTGDIVTQNKIKAVRYHFKAIRIDESKKDDSAIVIRILGIEDEETKIELLKEAVILEVYDSSEELTRLKNGEKCNGTIEHLENYIYKDKKNMARLSKHSFLVSIVAVQIILSLFKILTKLSIISKSKEDIIEFEKKLKLIKSNNLDLEEQIEVINSINAMNLKKMKK